MRLKSCADYLNVVARFKSLQFPIEAVKSSGRNYLNFLIDEGAKNYEGSVISIKIFLLRISSSAECWGWEEKKKWCLLSSSDGKSSTNSTKDLGGLKFLKNDVLKWNADREILIESVWQFELSLLRSLEFISESEMKMSVKNFRQLCWKWFWNS